MEGNEQPAHASFKLNGKEASLTGYAVLIVVALIAMGGLLWWLNTAQVEELRQFRTEQIAALRQVQAELIGLREDVVEHATKNRESFLDALRDLELELAVTATRMDLMIFQQTRSLTQPKVPPELP